MIPEKVGLRYLRVSGLAQSEDDKDGFVRQAKAIDEKAHALNIPIVEEYKDVYTGKTAEDDLNALVLRPEIVRLLGDLENGKYQEKEVYIILERLERLARDVMAQEWLYRQLSNRGAILISASDGINLEPSEDRCVSATRKFIRQILGAVAEYDREMITYKLECARRRKRETTGKCEGPSFYGDHKDFPEESNHLEKIKGLRSTGLNSRQIAEQLNSLGIMPRRGKYWRRSTVWKILKRLEKVA